MSMREHRQRLKDRGKVSTSSTIEEKEDTQRERKVWTLQEIKENWDNWKFLKKKNPRRHLRPGIREILRQSSYIEYPPNEEIVYQWDGTNDEKIFISVGLTKGGSYYVATRKIYMPTMTLSVEELDRFPWRTKRVMYFSEHNILEWKEGIARLQDVYNKGEEVEHRDLVVAFLYMGKLTDTGDYQFRFDFKIVLWKGRFLYCIDKMMRNYNPKKNNYVPCNTGFKFTRNSAGHYFRGWDSAIKVLLDKLELRTRRRIAEARENPDTLELVMATNKLEDEIIDGY